MTKLTHPINGDHCLEYAESFPKSPGCPRAALVGRTLQGGDVEVVEVYSSFEEFKR